MGQGGVSLEVGGLVKGFWQYDASPPSSTG